MPSSTNLTNIIKPSLGRTETTLVSTASNQRGAAVGLSLANITSGTVTASVYVTDATNKKAAYIKNISIGPNTSARVINGGEKLLLAANNTVSLVCDTADGLDVIFSVVIITYT